MTVEHLEDAPGLIAITCRRVASGFARLDPEIGMLAKHRPDPGRLRHQPFKRFPPCRACFWQQLGAISLSEINQDRKSVVKGKGVSVRVNHGGSRSIKKKTK